MANSVKWLDRLTVLSLCALILTLPFSKSAVEICIAAALISWVLKRALSYEAHASLINLFRPVRTGLNVSIYLFVLAGILSIFASASVSLSLRGLFSKLLKGVALYFIMAEAISSKKRLNLILAAMFLSMIVVGADGLVQLIAKQDFIRHYPIIGVRVSACFSNPNSFSGWLTIMFPLALSVIFVDKGLWRKGIIKTIMYFLICLLAICLTMTYSRGAWIGVVLALFFIGILKKNKFLLIAVPVVIALPFIIPPSVKERILTALPFTIAYSIRERLGSIMLFADPTRISLWREAMAVVSNFPVFGCGLNTYSIVAPHYKLTEDGGIYPHNSYLQLTTEMGFVGLIMFVFFTLMLFVRSLDNMARIKDEFSKNILLGLIAGLLGFLIHSFFDVSFYTLQLANLMWFVMGLIIAVQRIALKDEASPGGCNA